MEEIQLKLDGDRGAFVVMENGEQLGEMVIGTAGSNLTVYHTEVDDKAEGRGLAKKMFQFLVEHTRKEGLKLVPLCSFVRAQLKRNPAAFADIWSPGQ